MRQDKNCGLSLNCILLHESTRWAYSTDLWKMLMLLGQRYKQLQEQLATVFLAVPSSRIIYITFSAPLLPRRLVYLIILFPEISFSFSFNNLLKRIDNSVCKLDDIKLPRYSKKLYRNERNIVLYFLLFHDFFSVFVCLVLPYWGFLLFSSQIVFQSP